MKIRLLALAAVLTLVATACGSETTTASTETTDSGTDDAVVEETTDDSQTEATDDSSTDDTSDDDATVASSGTESSFTAEVWADNWFALYINGELVGEDSVSITTERSFNSETITFDAEYPLTIGLEAKDFKETDSGLEYIGDNNQQMGDGGVILQITDDATGEIVAVTSGDWTAFVVHRAPLNTDCESDSDPNSTCEFEILDTPADWASVSYDDSAWDAASVWSEADVDPKIGYDEIDWDSSAQLIWGSDLEVDNTVLLRTTVG